MRKGSKRKPRLPVWIALGLCLLAAAAAGIPGIVPGGRPDGQPSEIWDEYGQALDVLFIDVGQGDAILVSSEGRHMLVDAGVDSGASKVLEALERAGVQTLDLVAATHPHADHIGGMAAVLDAYTVSRFVMPQAAHTTKTFSDMLDALERNGCDAEYGLAGQVYTLGGATVTLLWPTEEAGQGDNLNNISLVMAVEYDGVRLLLTGDAEGAVEAELVAASLGSFDLLKAGHHGSRTSSTAGFLAAVDSAHVVISCGAGNDYGHPHDEVLERLAGRTVWRTDQNGSIRARVREGELSVYVQRQAVRP